MTWEIIFVLTLIVGVFGLLLWERIPSDIVAILAMCALLVTGILTPKQAFSVFSQEAPITIACMFILSAALESTGVISSLARNLNRWGGNTELQFLAIMLPLVAVISAFVNNTPVVIVFMPIFVSIAARKNLKPSKLLMPLSFATILGGSCTLIGTSTNLLASGAALESGQPALGMFELLKVGGVMTVVGLVYLLFIGRKLLPSRETLASLLESTESKQYLTEAMVLENSPLIGKRLTDTPLISLPHSRILDVTRGGSVIVLPLDQVVLEAGDRLRLTTVLSSMLEIKELKGIDILPKAKLGLESLSLQKATLIESVVGPTSKLLGRSIREINFRQRYETLILAVHRKGKNLREDFENVRLRFGDTLLMEGPESSIRRLRDDPSFLLLTEKLQQPRQLEKRWIAIVTLAAVVALATFDVAPISILTLLGAMTVLLSRCLDVNQMYQIIPWRLLFLIFGMLCIGEAMHETHTAKWLADTLVAQVGPFGPIAVLSALFFLTSILTAFISNNAVVVVVMPMAITVAADLGVDPRAFIIATALGASASYATPIGYQTNTLVYGAGGYRFIDFIKAGLPLQLICWAIASLVIPLFHPLTRQ